MQFIVAGGGIGGLTTALCLEQSGHEVIVLEQAPSFDVVGAGIQCGANAMRVFKHLGLDQRLVDVSVDPERIDFLHYRSGVVFNRMELGEQYQSTYGLPYLHVHRADLHEVLLNEISRRQGIDVVNAQLVTAFKESDDSVEVQTRAGEVYQADCLVGCDGVKSAVRSQLLGETEQLVEPTFTGNVAWRAVVPRERLPENFMDKIACNFVGHNKHAVIYYLRKQRLVNFVGVVEDSNWRDESWVVNSPWEEMKADYAGWHPIVQHVIDAADKDACYRWALYAHKPFATWSSDRVTLLGDAAHSTLPFMASGAAMAIEDARVLARAFEQERSVKAALDCYERNRLPRTSKIQSSSEKMGKIYHLRFPFMQKAAFWAMRNLASKQQAFLPEYDANQVALL